jgi:hypothetical protein
MELRVFRRSKDIFAEFEKGGIFRFDCFLDNFKEVFGGEVFYISLISSEVDGEGEEFHCTDVGVGEEDELDHVVHAVGVGQSVPDPSLSGQHVQNIQRSHPIG